MNLYSSSKSLSPIIRESVNSKIKDLLSLPFKSNNYYTKATMEKYKISNTIGKTGSTEYDSYVIAITEKYTIGIRTGKVDNQKFYNYAKPKLILKKLIEEIKKSA
jgi:membrane peptidoglycan carboxypeptidase